MRGLWLSLFACVVSSTGCGNDSSSSSQGNACNAQYDCPAGQSCGTTDGTAFLCAASGTGKAGDPCDAHQPTPLQCEDHLGCVGVDGVGTCRRWCSSSDPCPSGQGSCQMVTSTLGVMVGVCF